MLRLSTPCLFLAAITAHAQIIITDADMPSAGDTMRYQTTTLAELDGADTGYDHNWYFEDLLPEGEQADTAVSVASTPLLYQFFFNNGLLYPEHDADYALRGQSFDFQVVSMEDLYDYYKKESTDFRNVGFGATVNGIPASVQRSPIDYIYRFPLTYGDMDTSASAYLLDVPTLGAYGQSQVRYNEVDGWGALMLPADTFQVIRVKSTLAITDTIWIEQFGFGLSFPRPETIEYKWLAAGMDQPVLQVTTVGGTPVLTRFYYDLEDFSTAAVQPVATQGPMVFPNPGSQYVTVMCDGARSIDLIDAHGALVRQFTVTAGTATTTLFVDDIPAGLYGVRRSGGSGTTRLVVNH